MKLPRSPEKPPVRAPSPTKHAPVKMDHLQRRRSPSPTKASNPMQFVSPQVASPLKSTGATTSPVKSCIESTPTGGFRSILASKATGSTTTPTTTTSSPIKNTTPTGYRAPSPTKQAPTFRSVSPSKAVVERPISPTKVKDQGFITSLKAQGFEETSSKSKLVYNFEKKGKEEEEERTNYADNIFLKNDEASKGGRDTVGRRKADEVVENEEEVERKRDQLSPMRDNMVGLNS